MRSNSPAGDHAKGPGDVTDPARRRRGKPGRRPCELGIAPIGDRLPPRGGMSAAVAVVAVAVLAAGAVVAVAVAAVEAAVVVAAAAVSPRSPRCRPSSIAA